MCPEGFVDLGPIHGGATPYCGAGSTYRGPCASEAHSFQGLSKKAKARWSNLCQAYWPCTECDRDYHASCPKGWTLGARGDCAPPRDYTGPCRGASNFKNFNQNMFEVVVDVWGILGMSFRP